MTQISLEQALSQALDHQHAGRGREAESIYRQILAVQPDEPNALNLLGVLYLQRGDQASASDLIERAIAAQPSAAPLHYNLGNVRYAQGRYHDAALAYARAIELEPDYPVAYSNLSSALRRCGRLDEAMNASRTALTMRSDLVMGWSNYLYMLHFHPDFDAETILAEHRRWARRFERGLLAAARPFTNDRTPARRLRVGYISADLRNHIVGHTLLPILRHHDHAQFEVFCYSNTNRVDGMTTLLQGGADHWRSIVDLNDDQTTALIRQDRIDILVDLTQHMEGTRLQVLARKAAPVQLAHLGYPATTGLTAVNYRMTDEYLDPPGATERDNSEILMRLPGCYWCYAPQAELTQSAAPPCLANGYVTFGCLNSTLKITNAALDLWAQVLRAVPTAHLTMLAFGPECGGEPGLARLTQAGIDPQRVQLVGRRGYREYMEAYAQIDIALDPTPYAGGITSCDALWMGVPLVTLWGRTSVGRGGVSLLANLGLSQFIAKTPQEYVEIARTLAEDVVQLTQLRSTLRTRIKESPLGDAAGYTRGLEAAYRRMWERWCRP